MCIGEGHYNALAFADDLIFVATTPNALQLTINIMSDFLSKCGSFIVAIRNVPHVKKLAIDGEIKFSCLGQQLQQQGRYSDACSDEELA